MAESMDDVRYDIANTRQRMSQTLQELDARLSQRSGEVKERVEAAKDRLDPGQLGPLIQEHPWAALAVAFGIGLVLSGSGADRAVAHGTARAARDGSHAALDAARSARESVVERVRGGREQPSDMLVPLVADYTADAVHEEKPGLVDRVADTVGRALQVDQLESSARSTFSSTKLPTSI